MKVLVHALCSKSTESETLGQKVIWIKTKVQKIVALLDASIDFPPPVAVQGEHNAFVDSFVYLGNAIGNGDDLC